MTDKREGGTHLRLIFAAPRERESKGPGVEWPQDRQLAFPYPEESTVFLVYVETMGRDEFAKIVGEFTPRWIFDVRAVPRLDTIASSRLSAFRMFQKAKAAYVDVFGRLGIRSYRSADSNPAVWGDAVSQLLRESDRKGPYLFLFDDESLLRAANDLLPNFIGPAIGKSARFARIGAGGDRHAPLAT